MRITQFRQEQPCEFARFANSRSKSSRNRRSHALRSVQVNVLRIPVTRRAMTSTRVALPANRLALLTTIAVVVSFLLIFLPTPSSDSRFIALAAAVGGLIILVTLLSPVDARVTRLGVGL